MSRPPGYSDARKAAFDAATQALAHGRGPAEAARAAIAATEAFFQSLLAPLKLEPLVAAIACTKGCWWCCCQIVGVTEGELALVAQGIAALPLECRAAIARRAAHVMEQGRGLDQAGWWKAQLRCPLLNEDGLCAVHAHRPMACRAYNSADADLCRRSYEGEEVKAPVLAAQRGVFAHAQAGLAQALAVRGTAPGQVIALAGGVHRMLTSRTAP